MKCKRCGSGRANGRYCPVCGWTAKGVKGGARNNTPAVNGRGIDQFQEQPEKMSFKERIMERRKATGEK